MADDLGAVDPGGDDRGANDRRANDRTPDYSYLGRFVRWTFHTIYKYNLYNKGECVSVCLTVYIV